MSRGREPGRRARAVVACDFLDLCALWLFHGFLGLGMEQTKRIADVIEKVMTNLDELRVSAHHDRVAGA